MKFIYRMTEILDHHGKRKTLYQLQLMSERQLVDCGYSPELLSEGIKAWPWRKIPENIAPLRSDQIVNLSTVSTRIEHADTSPEKSVMNHQDAA